MEEKNSLNSDYFKEVYAANEDPWNFKSSDYEAAKYNATLAALPKNHYKRALEVGCSIGILTKLLAEKCSHLFATDISETALDQAKNYCADLKNITFERLNFPTELPVGNFDLILISEVAYYLSVKDWEYAMRSLYEKVNPEANIVLVHWLPVVHDYPQTGDEVHDHFSDVMKDKLTNVFSSRAEKYRIDVWQK